MTHTLATSLLGCWASSATPDLKITKQKKTRPFQRFYYLAGVAMYGTFLANDKFYKLVAK
jgi:hypothetical protein